MQQVRIERNVEELKAPVGAGGRLGEKAAEGVAQLHDDIFSTLPIRADQLPPDRADGARRMGRAQETAEHRHHDDQKNADEPAWRAEHENASMTGTGPDRRARSVRLQSDEGMAPQTASGRRRLRPLTHPNGGVRNFFYEAKAGRAGGAREDHERLDRALTLWSDGADSISAACCGAGRTICPPEAGTGTWEARQA